MACGSDTFVIRPPGRGGGGWEGGLSYGYDGHAGLKIRKRPKRAWVRPHLTCMLFLLFICCFFNEKTINDALNMGTNFALPSQRGPRRPLLCLFFLRNVALFFNIVYLVGTLSPAILSEVCVCPCNRL